MAQTSSTSDSVKQNQSGSSSSKEMGQEYVVRIPKVKNKRYSVMRFNSSLNVDVAKWACPKMERENNLKEFKVDEELPKYGAGSEFGRDQRDESRRKKYGIISKQYNPDEQPWLLKIGGKGGKKFKGIREGGVTENASYYVFTQAPDGAFEAFPIEEWYNFSPINRYKALSAEEAEEEFVRRDKVMNYFNIMLKKRQKAEEHLDDEEEGGKGKGKGKKALARKEFKISDADDWMNLTDDSDDNSSDNHDEGETSTSKKKKQPKKPVKKKKGKNQSSDEEALEESDEGDFDNREVDYITDSSSSGEEPEEEKVNREMKGVEDEEALRKLDVSGDEEEEEEENKETEETQEIKEKPPEVKPKSKPKKADNSSGDSSSDTSDSDFDDSKFHSAMFMQEAKKKNGSDSASSSRANTPTRTNSDPNKEGQRSAQKRKLNDPNTPALKRSKTDPGSSASPSLSSYSSDGITEDAIRRYLSRKPMTASELLQKFKSKKTGMNSEQLVNKIAALLKKVNPIKHHIKNKMYFSLKS